MEKFIYEYPIKTYFGANAVQEYLAEAVKPYGKRVMLAYGGGSVKKTSVYDEICAILKAAGKEITDFSGIMPNPTYAKVQEGAKLAKENDIDFILSVGGGSVIDCCKIVSAQAKLDEDIWELEYSKGGKPSEFIPMAAIVTVTGTGAEMNNGAVITNEALQQKSPLWGTYADFVILDSEYTKSVPQKQYISGCFDTLSHCMETYLGTPQEKNNLSDDINEAVMRSVIENTRKIIANPDDSEARSELAWASSMAENGILKIGKVTDFQAHTIEHQVGAYTNCNHGMGLAVIHPVLYRHIYKDAPWKFARLATEVFGVNPDGKTEEETALEGINALEAYIKEIGLPTRFSEMGITDREVIKKTADTCILTAGCCKKLAREEILDILTECL
ncbi:MAG: iron-containing alcohol dehydrogenase [Eubacterium sp.]|nr:iron-containing alcohol dehydrogenase [Eubacterium sp.]